MPPTRVFAPVKPVKTERTHEENQERAYIAASRRSDRSLEARVESARRASEIHKKRTGRSLRVTEQDVINEEMYEEEDDDLPSQYRRLTAHLQTDSAHFNRRLHAYMTNHVAMREALNEAISGNFSNHYPNAHQFTQGFNPMSFPTPLQTSNMQAYQGQAPLQSPSNASPHTPQSGRFAPYPMPGNANYRPNQQQQQQQQRQQPHRAMSIQMPPRAFPQMPPGQYMTPVSISPTTQLQQPLPVRRASLPVVTTPDPTLRAPTSNSEDAGRHASPAGTASPSKPSSAPATVVVQPASLNSEASKQAASYQSQHDFAPGPFSVSLPLESQQLMNPMAIPRNAFGHALMSHPSHENFDLNSFSFDDFSGASDPGSMLKPGANFYANQHGMSMTLAPEQMLKSNAGPTSTGAMPPNMQAFGPGVVTPGQNDMEALFNFGSNVASAAGTPGVAAHDSFSEWGYWPEDHAV